jgi:hypothetical protein
MEKIIEVNKNNLFTDEHFLLTERGWLKAKELKIGDKIIGVKGNSVIKSIKECEKRPDAPIVGNFNPEENDYFDSFDDE